MAVNDPVTVTIPAGTYSSTTSQEAADALALAAAMMQANDALECSSLNPLLNENLAIYYKCDDLAIIGSGPFAGLLGSTDSLGNCDVDTSNSSGDPVLINDGIIGNAINFPSTHINIGLNSPLTSPQSSLFDTYQRDFTVRVWMRLLENGTDDQFIELRSIGSAQWRANINFAGNKVGFRVYGQTVASDDSIPIDGNWHRIVLSRNFTTSEVSIKIDNGTTKTVAYTGTDVNNAVDFFFMGAVGYTFDIDEVAIWQDYVLTEADMTYDWNGGAGKTYPFT